MVYLLPQGISLRAFFCGSERKGLSLPIPRLWESLCQKRGRLPFEVRLICKMDRKDEISLIHRVQKFCSFKLFSKKFEKSSKEV
jgi:hypothetical protein